MAQCPVCDSSLTLYEHNHTKFGIVCDRCFPAVELCDDGSTTLEEIRYNHEIIAKSLTTIKSSHSYCLPAMKSLVTRSISSLTKLCLNPLNNAIKKQFISTCIETVSRCNYPPHIQEYLSSTLRYTYLELFSVEQETKYLFMGVRFKLTVDYFLKIDLFNTHFYSMEEMVTKSIHRLSQYIEKEMDLSIHRFAQLKRELNYLFYQKTAHDKNRDEISSIANALLTIYHSKDDVVNLSQHEIEPKPENPKETA